MAAPSQGFDPAPPPSCPLAPAAPPESAAPCGFLAPPEGPDEIGRLGHYRVLGVLGWGGMGIVLHAEDIHLQRPVAVKVLRAQQADDLAGRMRFLREARAVAALKSDHIVTVYHVGMDNDVPFMAMELLRGETLEDWLERGGRPALPEVLRVGRELALGLAAAHEKGVVHRDVKPSNVWLEAPAGRVKLVDFGLARNESDPLKLTHSGLIAGTPAYMSPEQAAGLPLDARSDLFSLGVVLYRLCTGTLPFEGRTTMALLTALSVGEVRPVREHAPDVEPALADLIERLLARLPDDRPPSALAVAEALQAIAGAPATVPDRIMGTPPPLPRPTPAGPRHRAAPGPEPRSTSVLELAARRPSGRPRMTFRRRKIVAAALLLAGAVAGTGLVLLWSGNDKEPPPGAGGRRSDGVVGSYPAPPPAPPRRNEPPRRAPEPPAPAEQVRAVVKKLKALNPHFDGTVTPLVTGDNVTGLVFRTDQVTDVSPLRALTKLRVLHCSGSAPGRGRLGDLSPLRGLPLKELVCKRNPVVDLAPLAGMRLTHLDLECCQEVDDLSPLRGMPLTRLNLYVCDRVSDLAPLAGMKLVALNLGSTGVTDLSPLRGMPVRNLNLFGCRQLRDLTPLQGMPLTDLNVSCCPQVQGLEPLAGMPLVDLRIEACEQVHDVTPLAGLKLRVLVFTPRHVTRGIPVLRRMASLTALSTFGTPGIAPQEFWKRYDAGEWK